MENSVREYHEENRIPHAREGYTWVFASNLAGRHASGSAKVARVNFHAAYGVGRGPTGNAYALPTKDKSLKPLSLTEIQYSIEEFFEHAAMHPARKFFVSSVTSETGQMDEVIGVLFSKAPINCSLPLAWKQFGHSSNPS